MAVAVSRGDLAPSLTVVGGYTADGANHLAAIDQLTSGDGESNLLPALSAFVDYTAVSAPAAVRRSIVALGLGYWDSGCATARSAQCTTARDTAARAAASGLDIVTIGQWHHMAEMAARSRGAFFWLGNAAQIETTLNAVDSALAGTLDHYTVRFLIDLGRTAATSGTVLFHYITVRASATAELMVPLVVVVD